MKLAAQLSDLSHRAHDPQNLPFTSLTFSKDHKTFAFNADSSRWEWDIATENAEASRTGDGGRRRWARGPRRSRWWRDR